MTTFFGIIIKKKHSKGVVFDSINNKPIYGVYIIFYSLSGNLKSVYTDKLGMYTVDPIPDEYLLKADKVDYLFPSKIITIASNLYYSHIYIPGEIIQVKESGEKISHIAVPLDPNVKISRTKLITQRIVNGLLKILKLLSTPIAITWIIITGIAAYSSHSFNYQILFIVSTIVCVFQIFAERRINNRFSINKI